VKKGLEERTQCRRNFKKKKPTQKKRDWRNHGMVLRKKPSPGKKKANRLSITLSLKHLNTKRVKITTSGLRTKGGERGNHGRWKKAKKSSAGDEPEPESRHFTASFRGNQFSGQADFSGRGDWARVKQEGDNPTSFILQEYELSDSDMGF